MIEFEECCHVVVVVVVLLLLFLLLSAMVGPAAVLEAKWFGTLPSTFPCASCVFRLLGPWCNNLSL
jgi:hypothetical protein